jgi:hypothetical protein
MSTENSEKQEAKEKGESKTWTGASPPRWPETAALGEDAKGDSELGGGIAWDVVFMETSGGIYFHFTMNCYCSILAVGFPLASLLLVSIGADAANLSHRENLRFIPAFDVVPPGHLTVIKLAFVHQLLLLGAHVFFIDTELVFFQDPRSLWSSGSDWELAPEMPVPSFGPSYPSDCVNTGLWRASPTKASIRMVEYWFTAIRPNDADDQKRLISIFGECSRTWLGDGLYRAGTEALIGQNLTYRFFDPILSVNANSIYSRANRQSYLAAYREITHPVVFHLAWYWRLRRRICGSLGFQGAVSVSSRRRKGQRISGIRLST